MLFMSGSKKLLVSLQLILLQLSLLQVISDAGDQAPRLPQRARCTEKKFQSIVIAQVFSASFITKLEVEAY